MSDSFTIKNLLDVDDGAPGQGLGDVLEARFPGKDLDAQQVGLSLQRIKPDARLPFGHHHDEAEEVYLVLAGSGRVKLDDEVVELKALDAVRVSPPVTRAFEAGPDGMDVLAFGQHHDKDGALVQGWWTD